MKSPFGESFDSRRYNGAIIAIFAVCLLGQGTVQVTAVKSSGDRIFTTDVKSQADNGLPFAGPGWLPEIETPAQMWAYVHNDCTPFDSELAIGDEWFTFFYYDLEDIVELAGGDDDFLLLSVNGVPRARQNRSEYSGEIHLPPWKLGNGTQSLAMTLWHDRSIIAFSTWFLEFNNGVPVPPAEWKALEYADMTHMIEDDERLNHRAAEARARAKAAGEPEPVTVSPSIAPKLLTKLKDAASKLDKKETCFKPIPKDLIPFSDFPLLPPVRHLMSNPSPTTIDGTPLPLGIEFHLSEMENRPFSGSASEHAGGYVAVCAEIAHNTTGLDYFRRHRSYERIVCPEDPKFSTTMESLLYLQFNHPLMLRLLPRFAATDAIGAPFSFDVASHGFPVTISATISRYAAIVSDFMSYFGDMSQMNVVEIGGGFGGQNKIVQDVFEINSYTMIDLPEALAVQSKFLKLFPHSAERTTYIDVFPALAARARAAAAGNASTASGTTGTGAMETDVDRDVDMASLSKLLLPSYDLFVSNYAFSELPLSWRVFYWELVISRSERGYIIDNQWDEHTDWLESASGYDDRNDFRGMGLKLALEKLGYTVFWKPENTLLSTATDQSVIVWWYKNKPAKCE